MMVSATAQPRLFSFRDMHNACLIIGVYASIGSSAVAGQPVCLSATKYLLNCKMDYDVVVHPAHLYLLSLYFIKL